MSRLWLRVRAPFAAFRGFQAGVYRASAPVMPPSAAYGLVLNLAGIEMRDPTPGVTTLIRADLPALRIAVGMISAPERSTLYQQLHSYPVGASGKELKEKTYGAKFWITPVRRELLVNYDGMIGVESDDESLLQRIRKGLRGELPEARYGLPFAGDNNLLIDRIDVEPEPPLTRWYARMQPDDPPRKGSCRLTVGINRTDNSRTSSLLCAPLAEGRSIPPEAAWTWTPSEPS
ncbi:type I-MYXAN CRISPR-associated protein Cas5/Cmx5/DevS [candidate division KSB1 bacterium]|nr:type I-MYXAN CRISPR-associated protein Cas5/Cmx5/DevS [candidate division KSB1 bacterium]